MSKSASQAVLSRMQVTLHTTRRIPHGKSRLVQAMSAWSVKTRRAPHRHSRDARVYDHTVYRHTWHIVSSAPIRPDSFIRLCLVVGAFPRRSAFEARKPDHHGSNDDQSAEILARTVRELDGLRAENVALKERGVGPKGAGRTREASAQPSSLHRRGSSGGLEDEGKGEKEQVRAMPYT